MARRLLIRPWTQEDDATLLALDRQGKRLHAIAARLRRSTSAVNTRKTTLQSEADGARSRKRLQRCGGDLAAVGEKASQGGS